MEELTKKVVLWALDKGLIVPGNQFAQYAKCLEEMGEFCEAHSTKKSPELGDIFVTLIILSAQLGRSFYRLYKRSDVYDQVHDIFKGELYVYQSFSHLAESILKEKDVDQNLIELISKVRTMAKLHWINPDVALYHAYEKIKARTGKTVDGRFIKEEDLNN